MSDFLRFERGYGILGTRDQGTVAVPAAEAMTVVAIEGMSIEPVKQKEK